MGSLWRDLRYALRTLRKSPGFVFAAILSLGLGIGANTALFSLLDALILRPLPVSAPERLVRIGSLDSHGSVNPIPGPLLETLRKDPLLDGVCGVNTPLSTAEIKNSPQPVSAHALSGGCYELLGVRPALGRLLTPEDDTPAGPRVLVLSYVFWQRQFGADPNVLGQTLRIEGVPFTIVGVTEPRFQGFLLAFPPSVSFPITQEVNPMRDDPEKPQTYYWAFAFARLKPGATAQQLRARLTVQWRALLEESLPASIQGAERAEELKRPLGVIPGSAGLDFWVRDRFQRPLLALLAISTLVLLVSCINLANLLLARGLQRQREIAIRLAIGARRWQVVCELLAESILLILAGLACALLLTNVGNALLLAALSHGYSGFSLTTSPDLRVLLFTTAAALLALLLFGMVPALRTSAVNLTDALKNGSRSAGSSHGRLRRLLICGQVALTLVLVAGAASFAETLRHLREQSLGFRTDDVLVAQLMPLPRGYSQGFNASVYYQDLLERMQSLPGVQAASLSHFSPLFSRAYAEKIRSLRSPDAPAILAPAEQVSDGFFALLRFPLLQGRNFLRSDSPQSPKTAIVSNSLAKRLFPAGPALGQHIRVGSDKDTQDIEIIGIAADARLMEPHASDPAFVYLNYWQYPDYELWGDLQLRYSGDSSSLISAVRRELLLAGHEYPLSVRTLADQRDMSLIQERLLASLGAAFGVLALALAGVGLFGLLSFLVTSRTSELGIRVALGAEPLDVGWVVIRETLALVGAGFLAGLPLSYAALRTVSSLLFGTGAFPVLPLIVSIALLLAVAALASVIPVRRATSVDPIVALRYD